MGVLCSKPSGDSVALNGRERGGTTAAISGLRAELSRPIPQTLITAPVGTLEVLSRPHVDGATLSASQYQAVWTVLQAISREGGGGSSSSSHAALPYSSQEAYVEMIGNWDRIMADLAGNLGGGAGVSSSSALRSHSPSQAGGGGGGRSPMTVDTAIYAAPQQNSLKRGAAVSFEEIAYKLFSNHPRSGAGGGDDDDDDDDGAGFDMHVGYQEGDPFDYQHNNSNQHNNTSTNSFAATDRRLQQLSPTSNRGGGGNGLLHANYNPLLSSSLGSPSVGGPGSQQHLQLILPNGIRRRSGSSSSSTTFPLDIPTIRALARVLFPPPQTSSSGYMSGLSAQLPSYFASLDNGNNTISSSGKQLQKQRNNNNNNNNAVVVPSAVEFLSMALHRRNSNKTKDEPNYFVSFSERSTLVGRSSGASSSSPAARQEYFDILRKTSRSVSVVLHPVMHTLSVALGRFTRKKRAHSSTRASPGLRRKTSNMSANNNNVVDQQPEPETLEECVRFTLRNFWRANEADLLQHVLLQDAGSSATPTSSSITSLSDQLTVVRQLVDRALKLLFVAGGGWGSISADDRRVGSNEDLLLAEALQVDAVNSVFGALTRAAGFDGFKGMHSIDEAEQWALCLRELSVGVGLIPSLHSDDGRDHVEVWWPRFVARFPVFTLGEDGKQTFLYLHAIIMGQCKLPLQPIMRADALRSVAKVVNNNGNIIAFGQDATSSTSGLTNRNIASMLEDCLQSPPPRDISSFRLFPVLATEGMGLESGEGHGPRKELFDLAAGDITAPRSLPMDITSAATFQLVSSAREVQTQRLATGATIGTQFYGKPVLMVAWKQRKLVGTFQQGDVITMTLERRGRAGSVSAAVASSREGGGANNFDGSGSGGSGGTTASSLPSGALEGFSPSGNQTECWTVEGSLEASNPHESLIVLNSPQARIPLGFRVVSCKVEQKRNPPFRHDVGNTYAWLNPMFLRAAAAAQKKSNSTAAVRSSGGIAAASAVSSTSAALDAVSAHAVMFSVGWLLANGVPNGLVVPCTLPPFLFRYAKHRILHPHSAYAPHPSDAALVNHSLVLSMEDTMRMSDKDFNDLLLAEGLDPSSTTREAFLESTLLEDALWNSGDAEASRLAADHLVLGFASSPLATCPILLHATCSKQARSILCGAIDEGTTAFSFQEHFRIVEDSVELTQFDFSVAFRDVLWDVLENGFPTVEGKRQLLKFITGRTLLPPRKKAEHIKVEFPMAPMNAKEFDKALSRLPSSHSCDNVLEVVNVLECLLFQTDSPFYARTGRRPGGVVLDDQKESAWSVFSLEEQRGLQRDAKKLLRDKLRQAVTFSGTYELDDAAVSRAAREAFEAANAGPTPQPSASFTNVAYNNGSGGGGVVGFDNQQGGGFAGYQSVSFEHNSSTNSSGTPNSKPPKYSGSVGAFHNHTNATGSNYNSSAASPQPQYSSSSPPHHNTNSNAYGGAYGSGHGSSPPNATTTAGNKRGSVVMTSAALRVTNEVEDFDFDDDDMIPLHNNNQQQQQQRTVAQPQEQKHYQSQQASSSSSSSQPQQYNYLANNSSSRGGIAVGGVTSLVSPPPAPLSGYHHNPHQPHQNTTQTSSMDSSGVLLGGRSGGTGGGGAGVGSAAHHRSSASSSLVGNSNNNGGSATRVTNYNNNHSQQHLSVFDKHNSHNDYATASTTATARRPTAAVADGFDSDVDVVELEDDLVATSRSTTAAQNQVKQTPPPPQQQQQRTADIDDLMTELFPARK